MPQTLPPQPETITLDSITYYITDAALINIKNEHDTIPFEEGGPEADGQAGPMPDAVYYEGIADDVRELWERGKENNGYE